MLCGNTQVSNKRKGLLPLRYMPKALLDSRTSQGSIPLGDNIYILDSRVAQGIIVGRSYFPCWRQISEAELHVTLKRVNA